jgi:hypothetical protein
MPDNAEGQGDTVAPVTFTQAQVDEMVAGLKNKNNELIGTNKSLKARVIPDGFDLTAAQEALAFKAKAEEEKQKAAGNYDTLVKQMADKHVAELKKIADERDSLLTRAQVREKKAAAMDAIAKTQGNLTLLLPHVMSNLSVEDVNGELAVRVVDAKGNALVADGSGTPMSVEQFVAGLKDNAEFAGAFAASGVTGTGARGTTNVNGNASIVLSEAEARDPMRYRAAKAEAEKRGVPIVIR